MKRMGSYCKAFYVGRLREFAGWAESPEAAGHDSEGESAEPAPALKDEDLVYIQEDYTVTRGIFVDEGTIFNQVGPEWIEFCRDTLNFAPPERRPEPSFAAEPVAQPA